jgi:signal transduction histidine kinase
VKENIISFNTLRQVPLFAQLKDEELRCVQQGEELWLSPGEEVSTEGQPAENFHVLLKGRVNVTKKLSANREAVNIATLDSGAFMGEIEILLGTPYTVSIRTLEQSHLFKIKKETFWEMITTCPSIIQEILRTMSQRVLLLQTVSQQQAKLISLGSLAAGLAHELNNPAAAAGRATTHLHQIFEELPSLSIKIYQRRDMTPEQLAYVSNLEHDLIREYTSKISSSLHPVDPLADSDKEEQIMSWLDTHGVADSWKMAQTMVEAGLDPIHLETIRNKLPSDSLPDVLSWLNAKFSSIVLLNEIEKSMMSISELVKAIKTYSYMDQAPIQEIDIHDGLENTLTILRHKLKKGSIAVTREYDRTLPRIIAYGSELNQVWTNIIDNAIDAIGERHGNIRLRTKRENKNILVEISDDGPGIPQDIQSRIFEQFFTTKGIGMGSGLGLSISYRIIVEMHKGDISFNSKPGETHFKIHLPLKKN